VGSAETTHFTDRFEKHTRTIELDNSRSLVATGQSTYNTQEVIILTFEDFSNDQKLPHHYSVSILDS